MVSQKVAFIVVAVAIATSIIVLSNALTLIFSYGDSTTYNPDSNDTSLANHADITNINNLTQIIRNMQNAEFRFLLDVIARGHNFSYDDAYKFIVSQFNPDQKNNQIDNNNQTTTSRFTKEDSTSIAAKNSTNPKPDTDKSQKIKAKLISHKKLATFVMNETIVISNETSATFQFNTTSQSRLVGKVLPTTDDLITMDILNLNGRCAFLTSKCSFGITKDTTPFLDKNKTIDKTIPANMQIRLKFSTEANHPVPVIVKLKVQSDQNQVK